MGSRIVKFDHEAICDNCENKGAHDFMGDFLCDECAFAEDAGEPLGLGCEHGEAKGLEPCRESKGAWYHRMDEDKDGSDWDSEPVFLCDSHSKNHKSTEAI